MRICGLCCFLQPQGPAVHICRIQTPAQELPLSFRLLPLQRLNQFGGPCFIRLPLQLCGKPDNRTLYGFQKMAPGTGLVFVFDAHLDSEKQLAVTPGLRKTGQDVPHRLIMADCGHAASAIFKNKRGRCVKIEEFFVGD